MQADWLAAYEGATLEIDLPIPESVLRFLHARGYKSKTSIEDLLRASLQDMRSPFVLKDISKFVDRMTLAYSRQEEILIYGDFDLDGTSATAIMVQGLKALGFQNIRYFQPRRLRDGYGLHAWAMEQFQQEGVDLVITVDVGISDLKAARKAKELGIDLIVTDHHQPKEDLPEAIAVINPNRKDCSSELSHLCGAGVAFYILLALKMHWDKQNIPHTFQAKDVLDFFIIGTLTDMVPLKDENKALCKHGILQMQKTAKPGLKVLLETLGYAGRSLSGADVAIGIAPKLNALSRMEDGLLPIDILLETSELEAQKKMQRVLEINDQRKIQQAEAEQEADCEFLSRGKQPVAFVYSKNFHKGVIGLVATKLCQKYNVPAFVGTLNEDGRIVGSARSPNEEDFSTLKAYEKTKDHLLGFGGHHYASGFQLDIKNAEAWAVALQDHYKSIASKKKTFYYDVKVDLESLNTKTMQWLDRFQPFGKGFEPPTFFLTDCKILDMRGLRGGHLRFQIEQNGIKQTALYFSPPNHRDFIEGDRVDLLVDLQWNYFNARKSLQLLIKDIRRHEG
tara:strand:- start:6991 stop:8682 length:1692 start_codon:yes stop_codon:yes gene_type:complete